MSPFVCVTFSNRLLERSRFSSYTARLVDVNSCDARSCELVSLMCCHFIASLWLFMRFPIHSLWFYRQSFTERESTWRVEHCSIHNRRATASWVEATCAIPTPRVVVAYAYLIWSCSVSAGAIRQIAVFSIAVCCLCVSARFCTFSLYNTPRCYFLCSNTISCRLLFAAGTSQADGIRERRNLPIVAKATFSHWPRSAIEFLRDTSYVSQPVIFSFAHLFLFTGTSRFSSNQLGLNSIA